MQLKIGGCPVTNDEIEDSAERYPLIDSAAYLCTSPAFFELVDDVEPAVDEAMDDEKDDDTVDETQRVFLPFTLFCLCTEDGSYLSKCGWGNFLVI